MTATTVPTSARPGELVSAATLLGVGLGGFLDGILLHQILQWHHMLSTPLPPVDLVALKVNMFWDGLFHAFTWTVTLAGLLLLWHAERRRSAPWPTSLFAGSLLLGWGLFNVVEGVIDHQLLGLHHVHPGRSQVAWDLGFLIFGAGLVAAGITAIARALRARRQGSRAFSAGPRADPA
jgi:uncharacterized membrane protein